MKVLTVYQKLNEHLGDAGFDILPIDKFLEHIVVMELKGQCAIEGDDVNVNTTKGNK